MRQTLAWRHACHVHRNTTALLLRLTIRFTLARPDTIALLALPFPCSILALLEATIRLLWRVQLRTAHCVHQGCIVGHRDSVPQLEIAQLDITAQLVQQVQLLL